MFCHNKYWLEMMTLLKQSLATKIGCVPLFYREITSNAFLLCSADKKTQERGRGIKLEKMCLLCGVQKEHQNLKNKSFFKEIEYLSESVPFRNPSSNFPREISSHWHWMHAAHILSRWNIPKVFRVFKVTWYCCSTNELSWGKGCPRGSAHRFYIGIRKDYWLKVENIKTQERLFYSFCAIIYQN